jgi:hypothetical protein
MLDPLVEIWQTFWIHLCETIFSADTSQIGNTNIDQVMNNLVPTLKYSFITYRYRICCFHITIVSPSVHIRFARLNVILLVIKIPTIIRLLFRPIFQKWQTKQKQRLKIMLSHASLWKCNNRGLLTITFALCVR